MLAKSYPLYLAVRMRRYGSLININPSSLSKRSWANSTHSAVRGPVNV